MLGGLIASWFRAVILVPYCCIHVWNLRLTVAICMIISAVRMVPCVVMQDSRTSHF